MAIAAAVALDSCFGVSGTGAAATGALAAATGEVAAAAAAARVASDGL
jgi:hypothetical protein